MNTTNGMVAEDRFAAAQVALYIFAILQIVATFMTATGAGSIGINDQTPTMQRVSLTANAVVNVLYFLVGYLLLARCLNRCTRLVWRLALATFLANVAIASIAIAANPNQYPVLTCCLSVAGLISVWNGRKAVRD